MKLSNTQPIGSNCGHLFTVGPTGKGKSRGVAASIIQRQCRRTKDVGSAPPTSQEKDARRRLRDERR